MSETAAGRREVNDGVPASLDVALAAFQAKLPKIAKGQTATVPGKDGKQGYKYDYADLADVSAVVLPALGAFGLSFTAMPTLNADGKFVLSYKLRHVSGETEKGEYPLPAGVAPQQLGSAITYARRYCLCAVTGVAPAGDDDDAQQAQQAHRNAGDAWDAAQPTQRQSGGQANGRAARPVAQQRPPAPAADEPDPDAQVFADEAALARTVPALREIHTRARDAHKLAAVVQDPATGSKCGLGAFFNLRKKVLEEEARVLAALEDAAQAAGIGADGLDAHVQKVTGADIESATTAQLRQATVALNGRAA